MPDREVPLGDSKAMGRAVEHRAQRRIGALRARYGFTHGTRADVLCAQS